MGELCVGQVERYGSYSTNGIDTKADLPSTLLNIFVEANTPIIPIVRLVMHVKHEQTLAIEVAGSKMDVMLRISHVVWKAM